MFRAEAEKLGLKYYNTGKPCKRGHKSDRYVTSAGCVLCHSVRDQKWRIEHLDIMRDAMVKWRKTNKVLETYRRNNRSPAQLAAELKTKNIWKSKNKGLINSYGSKHRAQKLQAMPEWANEFFIEEIYDLARLRTEHTKVKHSVDHIIPLQGKTVCGLHVEYNLQVIPSSMNSSKGNRVWPDMPT